MNKSFYFIRHGETDWNKRNIFQGHNDIPLNKNGQEQALRRRSNFNLKEEVKYFSSPLIRSLETAQIITNNHLEIEIISEFMECNSPQTAKYILNKKGIAQLPSLEKLNINGDSPLNYIKQVKRGIEKMFKASNERTPVLFAHGGTCAVICEILGIEPFKTPNCSLFYFELKNQIYTVQSL